MQYYIRSVCWYCSICDNQYIPHISGTIDIYVIIIIIIVVILIIVHRKYVFFKYLIAMLPGISLSTLYIAVQISVFTCVSIS